MNAIVLTRWRQTADELGGLHNEPMLLSESLLAATDGLTEITVHPSVNIPPHPNIVVVRLRCAQETIDAIKNDARYGIAWVLAENEGQLSLVVTEPQYDVFITRLTSVVQIFIPSVTENWIRANVMGAISGGRTRWQLVLTLVAYLKERAHA